jgi:hypothetical protein
MVHEDLETGVISDVVAGIASGSVHAARVHFGLYVTFFSSALMGHDQVRRWETVIHYYLIYRLVRKGNGVFYMGNIGK